MSALTDQNLRAMLDEIGGHDQCAACGRRSLTIQSTDPAAPAEFRCTYGCDPQIIETMLRSAAGAPAPASTDPAVSTERLAALDPTDAGNARRLAARSQHHLRAVTGLGWVLWDGTRWHPDDVESSAAMRWAVKSADAIKDECDVLRAQGADDKTVTARFAHHLKSQGAPRLEAALKLARLGNAIAPDDLDANPDVLNTPTGTVELRTGKLRAHTREDLISRSTNVPYQPGANASAWTAFLQQVLPDPELRAYVQRAAGYILTGHTSEQVFLVLLGSGANGKSVFVRTLSRVLGEYATAAAAETFMLSRRGGGDTRSDLVRLRGHRLVTTSETSDGLQFDERLLKEVTGGEQITARALYAPEVTFTPRLTLVVSCNGLPRFDGADYAMRRRLRVIPFSVQIPDEYQDPRLADKLGREAPSILAWAIEGARAWYRDGLGTCDAVQAASADSADEQDPIGQFLEEACTRDPLATTTSADMAKAYGNWADQNRGPNLGARTLGAGLRRHGIEQYRTKNTRGWKGISTTPVTRGDASSRDFPTDTEPGTSGTTRHHVSPQHHDEART